MIPNSVRLEEKDCSEMLFTLFKAMHIYAFNHSSSIDLEQFLSMQVNDTFHHSREFPSIEQEASDERKFYSQIISHLADWNAPDDIARNKRTNKWLSPAYYPVNNCSNLSRILKNIDHDVSETVENPTLAHHLFFSRNDYQSGTCITCSRDRNRKYLANGIYVMESKVFDPPQCSLNRNNESMVSGFKLELEIIEGKSSAFRVKKLYVNKGFKAYIETAFKLVGLNVNKNSRMEKIIHLIEETENKIENPTVSLKIVKRLSRKYGALDHMIRQGIYPRIRTRKRDEEDTFSSTELLNKTVKLNSIISKSCNPLYFENVYDVFRPESPALFDKIVVDSGEQLSSVWPVKYVSASIETLQLLSEQVATKSHDDSTNSILFKQEKTLDERIIEYSIDTIRFWM